MCELETRLNRIDDLLRDHTASDAENFRKLEVGIGELKTLLVKNLAEKADRDELSALRTKVYVLVALLFGSGVLGAGAMRMLM